MYEISLSIREEKELYSPFDESCKMLNSEVADYLAKQYNRKEADDDFALKIKCDGPVEFDRVRNAFQEMIKEQELHNTNRKRLNRIKQIWLFSIGSIFVAAGILLDGIIASIPVEIISIIGSFAVWEATNIWIVEKPRTRRVQRTIKKLKGTKILIEEPKES